MPAVRLCTTRHHVIVAPDDGKSNVGRQESSGGTLFTQPQDGDSRQNDRYRCEEEHIVRGKGGDLLCEPALGELCDGGKRRVILYELCPYGQALLQEKPTHGTAKGSTQTVDKPTHASSQPYLLIGECGHAEGNDG